MEQALMRRRRRHVALRWTWVAEIVFLVGASGAWFATHRNARAVATQTTELRSPPSITVVGHPAGAGAVVEQTGAPAPLFDGKALETGSRIVTRADGHAVLSLSTGTRLTMEEEADVTIVDNGPLQVFAIRSGAVQADVAKLVAGQRFLLRTPDAEIEVRGTSFRVAIDDPDSSCEGGTLTRVTVFEGVVNVRHGGGEVQVVAGQMWPVDCFAPRSPTARGARPVGEVKTGSAPASSPSAVASHGAIRLPARDVEPVPFSGRSPSDLQEQNDSFARALALKHRRASPESLAAFEKFVTDYPSSPLLESALVERMRLLCAIDRRRASDAARQYLARYPGGIAREEARAIERGSR
jgi:hypothetical protein